MHTNRPASIVELGTLRGLVASGKRTRPELAGRIERAATIVLLRAIEVQDDGTYRVESEREAGRFYTVNGSCECQDYERAPGHWCKHVLAVGLLERGYRRERVQAQRKRDALLAGDRAMLALAAAARNGRVS